MSVAVMLLTHGGTLGTSAGPSLMEKLQQPGVQSFQEVKHMANKMMRTQVCPPPPPPPPPRPSLDFHLQQQRRGWGNGKGSDTHLWTKGTGGEG